MKKVIALMLLCFVFIVALPATAQDAASKDGECDLPAVQKLIDSYIETLKTVKDKESDPVQMLDDLHLLAGIVDTQRASCAGLVFSGSKQIVIGPVTIPAGIYRAITTTKGYIIVDVSAVDGECGAGTRYLSENVFVVMKGQATDGAESIFTSRDCSALIEISNVSAEWHLSFERINND